MTTNPEAGAGRAERDSVALPDAQQDREGLRARACALRAAGAPLDRIATELSVSRSTAFDWTRHVRQQPATAERAQRRERERQAQALRRGGTPYKEIARQLGISPATAYSWTHRVGVETPRPAQGGRSPAEMREMNRKRWDGVLRRREQERQQAKLEAALSVGHLPASALPVLAALAYWCEGAKSKPWERRELLQFINSDPVLIRLFLAWLRSEGVPDERIRLRLSIHETADVPAAEESWAAELGVARDVFQRATLKGHKPLTNRKNRAEGYRGCLTVSVLGSRELYWRIEGLFVGAVHELGLLHPRPDRA